MNPLNFVRVRDRELSLWQSAVEDYVRKELQAKNQPAERIHALKHPLSIATADYVSRKDADKNFEPAVSVKGDTTHQALVYRSHLGFQIGEALASNNMERANELAIQYRKFCDDDYSIGPPPTGFATCPFTYASYGVSSGFKMTYNDWTVAGNNNINYGVINWNLPNDAVVGILGDWGTGMPDAIALLEDMMRMHKPDAIIHLGDIYYSGTPQECDTYFKAVFTTVFDKVLGPGNRIPVFSLPGNHDYYAWGAEYYNVVSNLNNYPGGTSAIQPASYFCLRTEDQGWQFLGMDTGYNDSNPANQKNPLYAGPWLQDTEITWHQDKMKNFGGATILLSHHQLYSSNTAINGRDSVMNVVPYFNTYLYRVFGEYIPTNVAAWIWGHEHNFVMYEPYLSQLATGTLVGNSAYEEETSANPYAINYPQVPYLVPEPGYDKYKLGTNADSNGITYYNHGYAIIDLSGRVAPAAPVKATYYQFPAWGDLPPQQPQSSLIYTQELALTQVYHLGAEIISGNNYFLSNQDGMNMQPSYQGYFSYYYPNMLPGHYGSSLLMNIAEVYATGQPIKDGDLIVISTTENIPYKMVTATSPWLYYTNGGNNTVLWVIHKKNPGNDPLIRVGDPFYLESVTNPGQYLKPVYAKKWSLIYLSYETGMDFWWRLNGEE